jgi:hypothetical protein
LADAPSVVDRFAGHDRGKVVVMPYTPQQQQSQVVPLPKPLPDLIAIEHEPGKWAVAGIDSGPRNIYLFGVTESAVPRMSKRVRALVGRWDILLRTSYSHAPLSATQTIAFIEARLAHPAKVPRAAEILTLQ